MIPEQVHFQHSFQEVYVEVIFGHLSIPVIKTNLNYDIYAEMHLQNQLNQLKMHIVNTHKKLAYAGRVKMNTLNNLMLAWGNMIILITILFLYYMQQKAE